jgi:hypothetical protein
MRHPTRAIAGLQHMHILHILHIMHTMTSITQCADKPHLLPTLK